MKRILQDICCVWERIPKFIIRYLMYAEIDFGSHTSKVGDTAIHAATSKGNRHIVESLLDAGADPDTVFVVCEIRGFVCFTMQQQGTSPLLFSIIRNRHDIAFTLLEHGADVNCGILVEFFRYYCWVTNGRRMVSHL